MKKLLLVLILILTSNAVYARQIPVKIYPDENISTAYDAIETGDKIKFRTKRACSYGNIKIAADTPVTGIVDYVQGNGWVADNAQVQFKKFIIHLPDGKNISTNSVITIDGFEELKNRNPKILRFFEYFGVLARGKEVDIRKDKDTPVYNIWINL
ncbi:MAG: hypothetical protein KIC80_09920 [Brachyspira sp.]|nr:hypothetical protein [Brachyspira sp.]